jgi:hypothetical protein
VQVLGALLLGRKGAAGALALTRKNANKKYFIDLTMNLSSSAFGRWIQGLFPPRNIRPGKALTFW